MGVSAKRFAYAVGTMAAVCLASVGAAAQDPNSNSTYSLGIEGFYDNYKEPDATVDSKAEYGSITGNYTHNWNGFFAALDGRVSYGQDDYSSSDGSTSGIPQWEFEVRPRVGLTLNGGFAPYIGIGTRYYRDEFKGATTTADGITYDGYDRRIFQLYLPIGFTYEHTTAGGLTIAPNLEYDQLLWGQVSSRLGTLQGYNNVLNDQNNGWGVRGSLMFGREENNWGWQVGPFFRYWDIQASDLSNTGPFIGEEPHNTRLQVGLALRTVW